MKLNILVIHETEYRDKMIYEWQVVPETLATLGHAVSVIEYPSIWRRAHPGDWGRLKPTVIKNVRRTAKPKGITLIQPGFIKIPVISRLTAWVYYWFLIPWVIKKYRINRILLYGVATNGPQTIFWSKLLKIPLHFRCLDVSHEIVPHPLLKWPAYLMEWIVYRFADEITAISPMMERYAKKVSGRSTHVSYLPAGAETDLFHYEPKDKRLLKQLGLSVTDTILVFAGTLYHFSGLDQVIRALKVEVKKHPTLRLLICGRGEQEADLKQLVKKLGLEKFVIFTGFIQYEQLPKYLNLADIGINPFISNPITDRIYPGKMYQYTACGKPSISSKLPGVMEIFPPTTTKHGLYYYDDMKSFFRLVQKLKHVRIKEDPNPSLFEISKTIEGFLLRM